MPCGSALGDGSRDVRITRVDRCQRGDGDFPGGGERMATGGLDDVQQRRHELGSQNPQLVLMALGKVLRMEPIYAERAEPGWRLGIMPQECDAHRRAHDLSAVVIDRNRVKKLIEHRGGIFADLESFHAGNQGESQGVVDEFGIEMQVAISVEAGEYSVNYTGNPAIDMIWRQRRRSAQVLDFSARRARAPVSVLARQITQEAPPLAFAECAVRRRGDRGRSVIPEKTVNGNLPNVTQFRP